MNNVLGFPFIFRGALDVRASEINEEMKMAATRALATELAAKSGAASRTIKLLVDRGLDLELREGLELEKEKVAAHMRTDDAAAGLRAFRERSRRKETS